ICRTDRFWHLSNDTDCQRPYASAKIVFLHVVAERSEAHSKQVGRLDLDAPGAAQRLCDVAALDLFDVRFEIEAGLGQALRAAGRTPARGGAAGAPPDSVREE